MAHSNRTNGTHLGARRRMLVVDDEPRILEAIRDHFARTYDVETADSAATAVKLFEERRPDLVFLDINMPGVDGLTLLTFLRKVYPAVPVIIITAHADATMAGRVLEAGAFGFVPKPFSLVYIEHLAATAAGAA